MEHTIIMIMVCDLHKNCTANKAFIQFSWVSWSKGVNDDVFLKVHKNAFWDWDHGIHYVSENSFNVAEKCLT